MKKELSIILPVYNEKDSLPIMVRLLISSLKFNHEIIIVHDTLEDNALEEANKLKKEFSNIYNYQYAYALGSADTNWC